MKIGLLGAGTIGFGVYEIAEKIPGLEITKVLDRRDIPQLRGKLTQDAAEILDDPTIDAVVELLGGVEPAHSWAVRALEAGGLRTAVFEAVLAAWQKTRQLADQ